MEKMMHSYIISGDGDAARSRAREMAAEDLMNGLLYRV